MGDKCKDGPKPPKECEDKDSQACADGLAANENACKKKKFAKMCKKTCDKCKDGPKPPKECEDKDEQKCQDGLDANENACKKKKFMKMCKKSCGECPPEE